MRVFLAGPEGIGSAAEAGEALGTWFRRWAAGQGGESGTVWGFRAERVSIDRQPDGWYAEISGLTLERLELEGLESSVGMDGAALDGFLRRQADPDQTGRQETGNGGRK